MNNSFLLLLFTEKCNGDSYFCVMNFSGKLFRFLFTNDLNSLEHSTLFSHFPSVCLSLFSLLNIKVLLFSHEILTRRFYKQFYGQQTASPPSTRHNSSRKKWAIPINNSPIHSSLTLAAPVAPPRTSAGLRPCEEFGKSINNQ